MDNEFNHNDLTKLSRSRFRKIFLKLKTEENRLGYVRTRNYCVKLLRQMKRQYFNNLNLTSITDNKLFRKAISPLFSEKNVSKKSKITLVEENEVSIDDAKTAQLFNTFLSNIIDALDTERVEIMLCDTGNETERLMRAIKKCSKYPSILRVRKPFKYPSKFSFVQVHKNTMAKEIKNR